MDKHIFEQIPLYLDDELQEGERLAVETHVKGCHDCRAALDRERELIAAIRRARPLYSAPETLRGRVTRLLRQSNPPERFGSYRALIAASAFLVLASAGWWLSAATLFSKDRPSLVNVAVDHHVRYLQGRLPLEVFSDSPEAISAWFAGKLRFNFRLPDYPQGPKPYHVEGARLVGFKDDYAAYVVYRLNGHPISLLVTSNAVAQPSGGEEIPWEGLRFHFQSVAGWKVLTWSDDGLTYALVSNLEERGQASCVVCHQDERVFRGLHSSREPM
ncbi:MAG TPA: zf-HC2 domain-containing protein [Candidatus Eisenbacteria bacterium]|nr:zf-HC2 domain-containing protein [Candidatus Eisenbacteria bacterium]